MTGCLHRFRRSLSVPSKLVESAILSPVGLQTLLAIDEDCYCKATQVLMDGVHAVVGNSTADATRNATAWVVDEMPDDLW